MKVKTKELLEVFKGDFQSAKAKRADLDRKIRQWKDEHDGKPYGNEVEGKSRIVSRDIKRQSEWQHAYLIDPFVSNADIVKCAPVTYEDGEAARQAEVLLNYQFTRQFDRYNFMSKAAKVADREGTVVIQTGWDYEDKEVETEIEVIGIDPISGNEYVVEGEYTTITETVVLKNQPTAKVCRNEDIFIDPTCKDNMDECQFVIHRYETDMSSLKKDGRYKNLKKINATDNQVMSDGDYVSEDGTNFQFKDNARKKLLVHEYWGNYDIDGDGIAEAIVCAWIDDVCIRLETNPYPDQRPPFLVMPFNAVPFEMHGESNAELIGDNQKIKTGVERGIMDNLAKSNNGQKGNRKGALDAVNKKKYYAGEDFEFNTNNPNDFWDGSYNQLPGSVFDVLGLMNNEIESITGTKSFSGGITGASLGGTATGARGAMDATSTRRMNIVRNIAENLVKPLMRKWYSYSLEFMEPEEVVRVTNEQFVPIRRDDLNGRIDIDMAVSTAEDNAAKAQELAFMIQTMGPNEDPRDKEATESRAPKAS